MSLGEIFNKKRQVIPRWHTYPLARWFGVIVSAECATSHTLPGENYLERIRSWEKSGKFLHAADLVGNALVLNRFDDEKAIAAATFILENKQKATKLILEITENFLRVAAKGNPPLPDLVTPEEVRTFYGVIAHLKARVKEYPRNPILWMDLAFYYSAIGQTKAAEGAVKVALSLNNENRYLLRSGSRFFMHIGSPDTALDFLRKSDIGRHDPWLVAAEIAISDTLESPSKRMKVAKTMIEGGNISKFHLSELASALGTIELRNGSRKKGKRLFSIALEDPTENTLAQATSLQNMIGEFSKSINPEQLAHSFEAETRLKFYSQDFEAALEAAKKWFAYQPFSSRPALAGSYIASVALEQFEDAIKIARMGLISSPREFMLKNNLAFSLASLGKTDKAKEALVHVTESELTESERYTLDATRALIAFRSGNAEEGRNLYRSALSGFKKQRDLRSETIAKFFLAREEHIIDSPFAEAIKEDAITTAKSLNLNELSYRRKV